MSATSAAPGRRRGRGDEPDQIHPAPFGPEPRFEPRIRPRRKVRKEEPFGTGPPGRIGERLHSEAVDGVQIGEEHDRHPALGPEFGEDLKGTTDRHPLRQRLEARPLDRRTVGEGIGKGDPELDHVGTGAGGLEEEGKAPVPARESRADVRNKRRLPAVQPGAEGLGDRARRRRL